MASVVACTVFHSSDCAFSSCAASSCSRMRSISALAAEAPELTRATSLLAYSSRFFARFTSDMASWSWPCSALSLELRDPISESGPSSAWRARDSASSTPFSFSSRARARASRISSFPACTLFLRSRMVPSSSSPLRDSEASCAFRKSTLWLSCRIFASAVACAAASAVSPSRMAPEPSTMSRLWDALTLWFRSLISPRRRSCSFSASSSLRLGSAALRAPGGWGTPGS
mmetsp:Transcript_41410/g.129689  ORF Transcript_41410/g.129689 Transcript_41410/m.129689 type:complete len:229 (+) Transcript_41410:3180-3866(+)